MVTTPDILTSFNTPHALPTNNSQTPKFASSIPNSSAINLDPDIMSTADQTRRFSDLHKGFDKVFDPKFGRYNGESGHMAAIIKLGPVEPPSTKPKLPFYNQSNLRLLQQGS